MSKKLVAIAAVVVIIVIGAAYYANIPQKPDQIKIGLITSLTGAWPEAGQAVKNGVILAQEQYQKAGKEPKVDVIVQDDATEKKRGLSAFRKLLNIDNVDAFINLSSPTIGAVYDLVVQSDLPFIQIGEQPETPADDNVFQIMPYSVYSAEKLGRRLSDKHDAQDVAVVYTNDSTVQFFVEGFASQFGNSVGGKYPIKPDTKDVRTHVAKIMNQDPEVLVFYMFDSQLGLVVNEINRMAQSEMNYVFGLELASLDQIESIVGDADVLNGSLMMVSKSYSNPEFAENYKERFGENPVWGAEYGYDAFNALMEAYDPDADEWQDNLDDLQMNGLTGNINFDERGLREGKYDFRRIKNGELPTY